MVSQGGEGGAYEEGGYTGQSSYSDGGVAAAIAGMGQTLGAALGSRTPGDKNKEDLKKQKRLEGKVKDLKEKRSGNTSMEDVTGKNAKIDKRLERIGKRQENISGRIKEYNEIEKPTLKSDIVGKTTPIIVNAKVSTIPTKEEGIDSPWLSGFNPAKVTSEKLFGSRTKK